MGVTQDFTVSDLSQAEKDAPGKGILSRTLRASEHARVIVFSFAPGEELSEHTSTRAATIQVLSGELEMTLAGNTIQGTPGTWAYLAPGLPHALRAREASSVLLTLMEGSTASHAT